MLEVTYGGLRVRADGDVVIVTTGARCRGLLAPQRTRPPSGPATSWSSAYRPADCGRTSRCGVASTSSRSSASCATDTMSGLGPDVLSPGDVLAIGRSGAADARRRPGTRGRPRGRGRDGAGDARATPGLVPRRGVAVTGRAALDSDQRQQPGGTAARGRVSRAEPDRRAAQRGPGPRGPAGSALRQAGALPGRPSGDGRLPGDRVRRRCRRGPVRAAPPRPAGCCCGKPDRSAGGDAEAPRVLGARVLAGRGRLSSPTR